MDIWLLFWLNAWYIGHVNLSSIGREVAKHRKERKLSQTQLAAAAGISRSTLDAIENGRAGELGFSKLTRLLGVLGLEMKLHAASGQRPTLEDLLAEERGAQNLDRRG